MLSLSLLFAASSAFATSILVTDPFYYGDSCNSVNCDVIGTRTSFDIKQATLGLTGDNASVSLQFDFKSPTATNLNAFYFGGTQLDIGDVFFGNAAGFVYGITLESHSGLSAYHLYQIANSDTGLETAAEVLNNTSGTYRKDLDVWLANTGLTDLGSVAHSLTVTGNATTAPRFQLDLSFTANSEFQNLFNGPGFHFQWSVATCGNDYISYTSPNTVPEPGTWLLIGGGLVGVGLLRRRNA